MASPVDIWNLALGKIDVSQTVQAVNEQSDQASACRQFYDFSRQLVLESAYWSMATKAVALALLLDQSTALTPGAIVFPGWRYIYAQPVDCLRFHAVTTMWGLRANPWMNYWWQISNIGYGTPAWGPFRPPYRKVLDQINTPVGQSTDILTDQDGAWGIYTTDLTNVNVWSLALRDCVAWQLAIHIAGPLSSNQNAKKVATQGYMASLSAALAVNLNEEQEDAYPDSPSIQARM